MYNGTTGRTDGEYKMKDTVYNSNLAVRRGRHPAKAAGLSTSGDSTGWITCCGRPFVLWPSPEVINRTSTKPDDYMIDLIGSERPALDCGDHLRITVLFVKRFFFLFGVDALFGLYPPSLPSIILLPLNPLPGGALGSGARTLP